MRLLLAICAVWLASARAGVPGALPGLFSEQCEPVTLRELQAAGTTIGIDVAGKLYPLVLQVGPIVNRGADTDSHYKAVHKWLVDLLSAGLTLLLVFDNFTSRYPPKAGTHKERAKTTLGDRVQAERLDAAHATGVDSAADRYWKKVRSPVHRHTCRHPSSVCVAQVLNRAAYLDLVHFTLQLAASLGVPCVVVPGGAWGSTVCCSVGPVHFDCFSRWLASCAEGLPERAAPATRTYDISRSQVKLAPVRPRCPFCNQTCPGPAFQMLVAKQS